MSRSISAGTQAAIAAQTSRLTHFVKMEFSGGTVYLTTAPHDIDWDGHTWEGIGGLLAFEPLEESGERTGGGTTLKISGVDQTILSALLSQHTRGRTVTIYLAHLDSDYAIISDPLEVFEGYLNKGFQAREKRQGQGSGTCTISIPVVSGMAILGRTNGFRTNLASHQAVHDGDTFFQHVPAIASAKIMPPWGNRDYQYPSGGHSPPGGPQGPGGMGWH